MAKTKTQRVYQQVAGSVLTANIYDPTPDPSTGKQKVLMSPTFDVSAFPQPMLHVAAAKGFGTYAATRANANKDGEDPTPEEIHQAYLEVYQDFCNGSFEPGRTGEGRENLLHEAIAEVLGQPLDAIKKQIKEGSSLFTPGMLGQIAKMPEVSAAKARLERQRAAEKEKAARAAMKQPREGGLDLRALFAQGNGSAAEAATAS